MPFLTDRTLRGSLSTGGVTGKLNFLVNELVSKNRQDPNLRTIGHCSGVMDVGADVSCMEGNWFAHYGRVYRTARRFMTGTLFV
jgi:2-methylaconitate cis-trans-isomerase PrpF